MSRKKKPKEINIKSNETKIFFGLIVFVLGLIVLFSPFFVEQTKLFDVISLKLGYSSIAWGTLLIYSSFFLLLKHKKFVSKKQALGLFLFSLSLAVLLSFWLAPEQINNQDSLKGAGGEIGKILHQSLNGVFGNFIEILIVILMLVISFSLITGTTLEQIRDFVENKIPEENGNEKKGFNLKDFFKKIGFEKKEGDIQISGEEIQTAEPYVEQTDEEEQERRLEEILHGDSAPKDENFGEDENPQQYSQGANLETDNNEPQRPKFTNWIFPSVDILPEREHQKQDERIYKEKAKIIEVTLRNFGIQSKVVAIAVGPTVLRFSLSISTGTKVSKVKNLSNDLALALASQTASIRIEAPIPGTSFIGVEIPNPTPNFVYTKDMVKKLRQEMKQDPNKYELPLILGKDITGKTIIKDLAKIPHLLVAGATGTGKSVAINSLLAGLLMTKTPDEVKFIMVDPKMGVEMGIYNGIPHLLNPVITDVSLTSNAFDWVIDEMMRRYRLLKQMHVKKLSEYNTKMGFTAMPYIVVVVDEMADLMLTSGIEVETKIQRLAQMGRAVGIHLILATQKPTVNVITGLIKSNIPGRMAFAVSTLIDSRVILDESGAETLLGNGDMLYKDQTTPRALRIQGTYTTTEDTENIIQKIKEQITEEDIEYSEELAKAIEKNKEGSSIQEAGVRDPDFEKALEIVILTQKASSSFLQRKMRIGYNKAARLIDELYEAGAIGPEEGSKPRKVLAHSVDEIIKREQDDEQSA
ncbi:MAG TPA: DNA translocase FtsK 4TM domain-containing protein [Candidatus Dojkabacteria bacterium]|nr:DNA translocase FtsK 4TM domain-containing protein [Candidatus Dojkabacteria bacterium]